MNTQEISETMSHSEKTPKIEQELDKVRRELEAAVKRFQVAEADVERLMKANELESARFRAIKQALQIAREEIAERNKMIVKYLAQRDDAIEEQIKLRNALIPDNKPELG